MQQTVSTSITKVKYITLGNLARESIWIHRFLNELRVADPIDACTFHDNNETSIIFTNNTKS